MTKGPVNPDGDAIGVCVTLPLEVILEFAIALPSMGPEQIAALGWTRTDRKRLLDHFLAAGRAVQGVDPDHLAEMPIEIALPRRDLDHLRRFAARELPRSARSTAMLDRVLRALDQAVHSRDLARATTLPAS
ncbi:hypothetical protein WBP06_21010 [Novosphingobium sp. BL-8H]|uniref:hypothetical protein n=1 Tax=Novosphingobium sp. BL-8H TaxID=3127640 RepID=UPI003757B2BA